MWLSDKHYVKKQIIMISNYSDNNNDNADNHNADNDNNGNDNLDGTDWTVLIYRSVPVNSCTGLYKLEFRKLVFQIALFCFSRLSTMPALPRLY